MSCNRRLQARIPSLVAGELAPIQSWLLRRHIATCPACQVQTERAQNLLSGLTTLAVAPTTDALQARVFDRLTCPADISSTFTKEDCIRQAPLTSPPRLTALGAVWTVSRRSLVVLGGLLVLAVTGVVTADFASQWFNRRPVRDPTKIQTFFKDPFGRTWYVSGNYSGTARLESGGRGFAIWGGLGPFGDPTHGEEVRVNVNGQTYPLQGPGNHDIRDDAGRLLGKVFLIPLSDQALWRNDLKILHLSRTEQEMIRARRDRRLPGGKAVSASPYGMSGFDRKLSLSWNLRGSGTVVITTPTDSIPLFNASTPSLAPGSQPTSSPRSQEGFKLLKPSRIDQPYFEVTLEGRTSQTTGYGMHEIRDDRNRTVLIVEIMPLFTSAASKR